MGKEAGEPDKILATKLIRICLRTKKSSPEVKRLIYTTNPIEWFHLAFYQNFKEIHQKLKVRLHLKIDV